MKEAELPDGTILEFPDDTPDAVMDRVVRQHIKPERTGPQSTAEALAGASDVPLSEDTGGEGGGAVGRIGRAVVQGLTAPPFLTPEAKAAAERQNQQTWVGRNIVSPLVSVSELPFRGLNAFAAGTGQAAYELGTGVGGPALGRDLYMFNQLAPTLPLAGVPHPSLPRVPERPLPGMREPPPVEPQGPPPAFVPPEAVRPAPVPMPEPAPPAPPAPAPTPDVFVPPRPQEVPLAEQGPMPANAFAPKPEPAPAAPEVRMPERQPGAPADLSGTDQQWLAGLGRDVQDVLRENGATSLGAMATPEEAARMTPAQMKANRRMAELGEILAPPEAGEDLTIHVPGSEPTLAERSGDPRISQVETVARARAADRFDPRLSANSQARIRQFDNMSGSDPQLVTLGEQQSAAARADTVRIMQTAHDADATPLLKYYDDLLNDPRIRERDDVVKILKPLRDALFDETGQLKTDPQSFWGMHDNLMARLAKAKDPLQASSAEKFAFDQLLGAKKATDAVMNGATDGAFQTFLDNQASFFQRKNAMEVLQKFRTKLVDPKTGHIYADKFHRWLADLAVRRGKPGVDAAMDLPDEVMRGLIDIDNDLKRASRIDLGKARGSGTNLFFEVAKAAGIAGAHTAAAFTTGGAGNVAIQLAQPTVARWRLNRLVDRHLAPPPEGFRPNPFAPEP